MKCAVYGVLSINSVIGEGAKISNRIGGEAFYAYNGLKSCGCNAKVISGVSKDFQEYGKDWLEKNAICKESLLVRTDFCIHNRVEPDGGVFSVYGKDFSKFNEMAQRIFITHLAPYVEDIELLYLSDMLDNTNAQKLMELKQQFGFRVMWQIPKVNIARERELILQNYKCAEMLSICAESAFQLFDCHDEKTIISRLAEWDRPIYYLSCAGDSCLIARRTMYRISNGDRHRMKGEIDRMAFEATAAAVVMWALSSGFEYPKALCTANAIACNNVFSRDRAGTQSGQAFIDVRQEIKNLMDQIITDVIQYRGKEAKT